MLLCFAPGRGELGGRLSAGLGQHEEVGASACCLSWKREDGCILLTAHAAPETGNATSGGRCPDATGEGGLAPCPRPLRCVHGGGVSHNLESLGALVLPGHGALSSGAGHAGARMWWQMVSVALLQPRGWDPQQPPALPGLSPCLQLCWGCPRVSSWGFARSLDMLKVHRAINTQSRAASVLLAGGGLLKPNGLSLQLTLCVCDSPLCGLEKEESSDSKCF